MTAFSRQLTGLSLSIGMNMLSVQAQQLEVYTTAMHSGERLSHSKTLSFDGAEQPVESGVSIYVYPESRHQEMLGIGGAVTDATAEVFSALSEGLQEEILKAYFDTEDGIGYTLIRVPIHSADFARESFTYIDDGDSSLTTFSVAHDREYRLPLLRRIQDLIGSEMVLYASPWSPPAFMKDNNNMLQGGHLLPEFADAWAQYYIRFIQEYEKEGFPVWGLTIQNEPMAVQRWESCIYSAAQERDFLKDHLGPALYKAGMEDKKVVIWDHNRDLMYQRACTVLADEEAAKYVWGVGFHWYETWAGGEPMFDNLSKVKEAFPDKQLIFTEGCNERFEWDKLQYWPNAERYGLSMINDFNRGTVAWTDWNILLDETGGPNHMGNLCFAPLHGDLRNDSLIYTPSYYYIGHFSRFIRPGAVRLGSASSRSTLETVSFQHPDGKTATVVMNTTDEPISYQLLIGSRMCTVDIPARAMQTLVYTL